MTLLPIVDATLRQASRKRWTYWSRVIGVGVAACVAVPLVYALQNLGGAMSLGAVLAGFSPFILLILLNVGASSTSDCISEEKREGTLGLLFLTDLKGADVALGKLVGACTQIFISWLAMLPLAAMLVLVGGFTWQDVLRIILGVGNGLFCGVAAGLLGSSFCRERKRANTMAFLWIAITCVLPPITAGLLVAFEQVSRPPAFLMAIGPGPAFWGTFEAIAGVPARELWTQLAVSHGVAWVAIGLACWFTPRRWQDRQMRQSPAPVAPKSALPSDDARKEQVGLSHRADRSLSRETLPERRNTHPKQRPELLNMSPFAWLLRRYCWTPMTPWMILLAGAVVTSLICWLAKPDEFQEIAVIAIWVLFFVHAAFKAKLGELASQGIYDEKRSGALEHILVTLVKPREIVSAHWRMLRSSFGPAMLLLILIDLAFAAGCFVQLYIGMLPEYQTEELAFLLFFWLYLPATLLMDSYVLMQVGMWEALRAKKKWSHVRGNAFAYVVLLPSGIFIVFWIALLWLTDGDAASFPLFAVLWCSLSVAANLFWIRLCRPILRRRFRKIAQETATPVRLA